MIRIRPDEPTADAKLDCVEWLSACLELGWTSDQLADLESLWWLWHDDKGRKLKVPRLELAEKP
jgi:hypothetical protein